MLLFGMMCSSIQERPNLKLASHGRKVEKIGRSVPEIEGLVAATKEVARGDQQLSPSNGRADDHTG